MVLNHIPILEKFEDRRGDMNTEYNNPIIEYILYSFNYAWQT